jgi:hypothetical protein
MRENTSIDPTAREAALARIAELETEAEQLRGALQSRIVIEQAKGVLAERLGVGIEEAFEILRYGARSTKSDIHELARRLVNERTTPAAIIIGLARAQRIRAAWLRDIADTQRARVAELSRVIGETIRRAERPPGRQ